MRAGNVAVTQHAFEEMNDDDLLQVDVGHCILRGAIVERQWDKEWLAWKYLITGATTDGLGMQVVVKFGHSGNAVVITTYLL